MAAVCYFVNTNLSNAGGRMVAPAESASTRFDALLRCTAARISLYKCKTPAGVPGFCLAT